MKRLSLVLCAAFAVVLVSSGDNLADKKKPDIPELKGATVKAPAKKLTCPVSGKATVKTATAKYKGTVVEFCCPGCPGAFAKNTEKYATKANLQLVMAGRAKQVKCPFTGGKVNKKQVYSVGGEKVGFCCGKCAGKVKDAEDKVSLVFNDKAFDKGFKVVKAKKPKKEKSKEKE